MRTTSTAVPGLEAPQSYLDADPDEIDDVAGTCGPGSAQVVVPDRVFGADFSGACRIHDWDYAVADEPREVVDERFRRNLLSAAGRAPWVLRPLAWLAARWYFRAVRLAGAPFYGNA